MTKQIKLSQIVPDHLFGKRLDQVLAEMFPDYSRSRIKEWILADAVQVEQQICNTPRQKMFGGEQIDITADLPEDERFLAEPIALDVVFEDEHILVINKPAGLVVHPGAGNADGTLLNALLHHCPGIGEVPRAGIVHRLDKDTTGLMVVAKTIPAQTHLVEAMQAREITREYEAVCYGAMTGGGSVNRPIGRHPTKRTLMAVLESGKPAVTHYRVMEKYRAHTRLRLRLETGRTHQIRVHMTFISHPLVGDPVYGGRPRPPRQAAESLLVFMRNFRRQALHAIMLKLAHPITGQILEWHAPLPDDMVQLNAALRADTAQHGLDFV
ncbi:23S rRNA pseudouridine(1911/1915/1917) synthase RluD [Alishewanella sp. SMS8]|uniref:23S rRNA pseudouridine(1911/1915/1917) synthase RluD n=1 Tax=unclassified Alishewanella TaxID=2628974 RepID=UPI00274138A3|nr:23S rRNA pseudouridine(1911/1915/1917) synthase RluD [Alishewanella sp. SMS8]MDP4943929.1 23S rRNA pseudouridine(1911/1915/1917) synthase RluD [Alishewanella sp.]MDP5187487.1 23S rRNA pseudouridine(1911/1915/1917) synthase RluD [Alishewanella sp.]MDP5206588.1 23S rRNA pseudouridine(1911/1915/1917) synthase RluD [Alishewanella sp. SMS9]MDP5460858.1 23S rRNA pseudouridine(1911/1915/1917) synthase RluD [Alishewanella sp. SMS8]